jgi:predicted ABC-class ATPase
MKIDGRGYKAYKNIRGAYDYGDFLIFIDHVQGDPFASPSRIRARVYQELGKFPIELYQNKVRKIAIEDYLTRRFADSILKISKGRRGTGRSGVIEIVKCGQAVLERTSVEVNREYTEASFFIGLPAEGRKILGREAVEMFFNEIPSIVNRSLFYKNLPESELKNHIEIVEDASYIRSQLKEYRLVAFIANGSILPRQSGVVDTPKKSGVVYFRSPPELEVEFETPNSRKIKGLGIPEGITLIVGGGYHGKSTLLDAISKGVYNHLPGDGREFVITIYDAVLIRAEDGRYVENVDISPFISNLPSNVDTKSFSTSDASGSTSQAANIIEALEIGAKLLLIDEDTSATNFMIRDKRMQELVSKEKEPITPLIDKIRTLYLERGVSTILVMGGSGDYFDVADTVIMMDNYIPRDVTKKAKEIAQRYRVDRILEGGEKFGSIKPRKPLKSSIDPKRSGKVKIRASTNAIQFGYQTIDLSKIHQIVELPQIKSIGDIMWYMGKNLFNGKTLSEALDIIDNKISNEGLSSVLSMPSGDYACPRKYEIAAAINRLRTLKCE